MIRKLLTAILAALMISGTAAGLTVWELSLKYEDGPAGIPGTVGLGLAGLTVLYGLVRPFIYRRIRTLAGISNGINPAIVAENHKRTALRLSYTM
jgi:hypothetical protein